MGTSQLMKIRYAPLLFVGLGVLFIYLIRQLATCLQPDFGCILLWGIGSFILYGLFYFMKPSTRLIFGIGLVARLVLLLAFPALSDDIYRFIWDGRLTALGMNPYSFLPSDIIGDSLSGLNSALYTELNSPHYYTIYPPVSQLVFWLSTLLGEDVKVSSLIIKSIFILAEIFTFLGIVRLLQHLEKPSYLALIYWLNPLIIIEGVGNLHFETLMICFLVWSIYFLFVKKKIGLSAGFMALSIGSKLLPLIFLPYLFFRLDMATKKKYFIWLTGLLGLIFIPIVIGVQIANFGTSLDLYFQKFEFNASIYYLLRYIGKILSGYNLIYYIGPLLGLTTLYLILKKAHKGSRVNLSNFLEFSFYSFTIYLLLATTIHPWYLSIPVFLSVFSTKRYAIIWSALILLTYINYSYTEYSENYWIVALEYVVVWGLFLAPRLIESNFFKTKKGYQN